MVVVPASSSIGWCISSDSTPEGAPCEGTLSCDTLTDGATRCPFPTSIACCFILARRSSDCEVLDSGLSFCVLWPAFEYFLKLGSK